MVVARTYSTFSRSEKATMPSTARTGTAKAVPIVGTTNAEGSGRDTLPETELHRLWSASDVSRFLGVPVSTLHQWRYLGRGPAAYRVGKHLRYDPDAVRQWLVDDCADEPA